MDTSRVSVDVAVIGAGIAGLVCAQQLQQTGYRVVVLEKSRGLGGRVATRRLTTTCADHGLRYFEKQGPFSQAWLSRLVQQGMITPWSPPIHRLGASSSPITNERVSPRYCAPAGATAAAKFLAAGLEIWRGQRVLTIAPADNRWTFTLEPVSADAVPLLAANAVVIAIPAPQAKVLLDPLTEQGLPADLVSVVAAVAFDPCITVMATYSPDKLPSSFLTAGWERATGLSDAAIDWIGLETSKRDAEMPVVVVQSTAEFAQIHLESPDLNALGQQLLDRAAEVALPWLSSPDQQQVHRWRYARVRRPCPQRYLLTALPLPLVCCGDWCGGNQVEAALQSGIAAAHALQTQLSGMTAPSDLDPITRFERMLNAIA